LKTIVVEACVVAKACIAVANKLRLLLLLAA
jgi:hypothetical protein